MLRFGSADVKRHQQKGNQDKGFVMETGKLQRLDF